MEKCDVVNCTNSTTHKEKWIENEIAKKKAY